MRIRNSKWLVVAGYNPHKEKIKTFLDHVSKELDKYLPKYENLLLLGDWNSAVTEKKMENFCETYNLQNLIKDPTCYKNPTNPSSIDVMLTNKKLSFQNSMTVETGLSDFHKMTVTVMKRYFKKKDPVTIVYRDLKSFDGLKFRDEIREKLEKVQNLDIDIFKNIFTSTWDAHAPVKRKVVRGNNAPFMNKTLSKAFMHRSKLKNKYQRTPTEENKNAFKKHRNFCTGLLKREKRKYYNNLDLKDIEDNRKFWKSIKPLFTGKSKLKSCITLLENEKLITDKTEVAEILNNYFIEAVSNLEIEKFYNEKDEAENTPKGIDEVIDSILDKYKTHPSILKIKENVTVDKKFKFTETTEDETYSKVKSLDTKKASTENDIPATMLIGTNDIISKYLTNIYNESIKTEKYPDSLKKGGRPTTFQRKRKNFKK